MSGRVSRISDKDNSTHEAGAGIRSRHKEGNMYDYREAMAEDIRTYIVENDIDVTTV